MLAKTDNTKFNKKTHTQTPAADLNLPIIALENNRMFHCDSLLYSSFKIRFE